MDDFSSLAVVVVNYGSHELVARNLSDSSSQWPGATVVVVDNYTSAAESAAVEELCAGRQWVSVINRKNLGFGEGCNVGVECARAEGAQHVMLLNPDAWIDGASTAALIAAVRNDPFTLAGPRIEYPDGRLWSAGMDLDLESGSVGSWQGRADRGWSRTTSWLTGACLVFDLRLWDAVGGFADDYFLYWEDIDLSTEVLRVGGRIAVVEEATATHEVGATQGAIKSEAYYYYNIRNRSVYARRHLEPADRRRWRRSAPRAAWDIITRGGRRQLLTSRAPWRAWWRGLRHSNYGI